MSSTEATKCIFVVLFLTTLTGQYTCECGQIASRFYYDNQHSNSEATAPDAKAEDMKLKLLEESRTDPIPMEFYKELDNINDISELIDRYVDKDSLDPQVDVPSNMKRNVERSRAVIPKSVTCAPKSTIVPLTPLNGTKDPGVYYYPSCTQVNRCGGCCSSKLTTCQPTKTEIINFVIKKIRYAANNKLILDGNEIVLIEEHKNCSCNCLIKAEDCNSYQIYDPSRCSCICKLDELHDLVLKCLTEDHKIWDENKCRCVCRDTDTCTTGTIFDENQCKCVESLYAHSKGNSSLSLADRKRFIVKAIPVDPDSS